MDPARMSGATGRTARQLLAVAIATCLACLALTVFAGASDAGATATGCSGSLIVHKPITDGDNSVGGIPGKTTLAWLDVYYNSATGVNCAKTQHAAATWGKVRHTYVDLIRCTQTVPGPRCTTQTVRQDDGDFAYWAGPVSVAAPHNCIQAFGMIFVDDPVHGPIGYNTITSKGASHC